MPTRSRKVQSLVALVASLALLVVGTWFDRSVLYHAAQMAGATFDPLSAEPLLTLGVVLAAGATIAVALLAWRADSLLVAVADILIGAFVVTNTWTAFTLGATTNGAPPVLPAPLPAILADTMAWTHGGQVSAAPMIGAGMLIGGLAVLVHRVWARAEAPRP